MPNHIHGIIEIKKYGRGRPLCLPLPCPHDANPHDANPHDANPHDVNPHVMHSGDIVQLVKGQPQGVAPTSLGDIVHIDKKIKMENSRNIMICFYFF